MLFVGAFISWAWEIYLHFIEAEEDITPEECGDFIMFLLEYCEKHGIDPDGTEITKIHPDGSITVTFPDGSTQTFKKIGGCYESVPTPSDDLQPC